MPRWDDGHIPLTQQQRNAQRAACRAAKKAEDQAQARVHTAAHRKRNADTAALAQAAVPKRTRRQAAADTAAQAAAAEQEPADAVPAAAAQAAADTTHQAAVAEQLPADAVPAVAAAAQVVAADAVPAAAAAAAQAAATAEQLPPDALELASPDRADQVRGTSKRNERRLGASQAEGLSKYPPEFQAAVLKNVLARLPAKTSAKLGVLPPKEQAAVQHLMGNIIHNLDAAQPAAGNQTVDALAGYQAAMQVLCTPADCGPRTKVPATDLAAAIHQPYAAVLRAQKQGTAAAAAAAAANAAANDAAPAATLPRRVRVVWGAVKVRQQPSRRVSVEQQAHMVAVWEDLSKPSPCKKHQRKYNVNGQKVVRTVCFIEMPFIMAYQEYRRVCLEQQPPQKPFGLSTFLAHRPRWVQRLRAWHRHICMCKYCVNMQWVFDALAVFSDHLDLQDQPLRLPAHPRPGDFFATTATTDAAAGDGWEAAAAMGMAVAAMAGEGAVTAWAEATAGTAGDAEGGREEGSSESEDDAEDVCEIDASDTEGELGEHEEDQGVNGVGMDAFLGDEGEEVHPAEALGIEVEAGVARGTHGGVAGIMGALATGLAAGVAAGTAAGVAVGRAVGVAAGLATGVATAATAAMAAGIGSQQTQQAAAAHDVPLRRALPTTLRHMCAACVCPRAENQAWDKLACVKGECRHCGLPELRTKPGKEDAPVRYKAYLQQRSTGPGQKSQFRMQIVQCTMAQLVQEFKKQLRPYLLHQHLAAWQQASFKQQVQFAKDHPEEGVMVASWDWAERLAVAHDNEVMTAHWHTQHVGLLVACLYFHDSAGVWREETHAVFTDGGGQGAAVGVACLRKVFQHLLDKGDITLGPGGIRHVLSSSDGCASQFKCGDLLQLVRDELVGPTGVFQGKVKWQHLWGATSHFKGRHDQEGGSIKNGLSGALQKQQHNLTDEQCVVFCTAVHCVQYAQQHLTTPASARDPSAAHRRRAKTCRRVFHLAPLVACPTRASKAIGIAAMHRVVFDPDGQHVSWSPASCGCDACCLGQFQACHCPGQVPALVKALLREQPPPSTAAATTATAATGAAPLAATAARHTAATATALDAATTTVSAQGYGPAAATGPLALPPPAEVALAAFLHATFLQPLPFVQLPMPGGTAVHLPPLFTPFPQMPTCLPNKHVPSAQPQPPRPALTTPDSQLCDVIQHIPGAWAVVEGVRAARRKGAAGGGGTTSEYKITKPEIEAVLRHLGIPTAGLGQCSKAALVSYARQQLEGWLEHADAAHAAAMEGPRDALD